MSHKDWKGPGWYDRWSEGECTYTIKLKHDCMYEDCRYSKRAKPKPPNEELADGLYLVVHQLCADTVITSVTRLALRKDGRWMYPCNGEVMDNDDRIRPLERVPTEPVEGDKS